jgi:hypothetical protein
MLVYVTISAKGVHCTEVEARMDEEIQAKHFYAQLKPLLNDLSRKIKGFLPENRVNQEFGGYDG